MQVLAGALGGLAGIIGFIPFLLLSTTIRRRFIEKGTKTLKLALLIPVVSFIPMVVAITLCWWLAVGYLMVFTIACVVVFLMVTVVYTALQARR